MSNTANEHTSAQVPNTNAPTQNANASDKSSALRWARETATLVVTALVLATLLKMFLIQTFYIPTGSMLETLQIDDRVMVEKVSYLGGRTQARGCDCFPPPGA